MEGERLDSQDFPFKNIRLITIDPVGELKGIHHQLDVLGLSLGSTGDEVRRVAISFRRQFEEKGLNQETVRALRWALKRSEDCGTDEEFLWFLIGRKSFEQIKDCLAR